MVAWGYGMGPCEAQDLVGLDRVADARNGRGSPVLPRMVAEGRLGKAAGWGYYRYPGGGGAVVDPLLDDLVAEEARFAHVTRRDMSDADLVARLHEAVRDDVHRDVQASARLLHFPIGRLALI